MWAVVRVLEALASKSIARFVLGQVLMVFFCRYCLSHSPVPVIVVRPGRKLRKAVEKRRADPKRGTHFE